ncbi:MAG: FtsX-like permease family protein [Chloroflexi bacterium]|nr:FtsX-like permease family protein [Chloroflexota bacterium]
MNRSTFRKIWGDLWTRKGRTLLVSVSIFIGVTGVVTLITAGDLLVKQLQEDIQEDELPMLEVYLRVPSSVGDIELQDQAYIDDLSAAFPDITAIEGQSSTSLDWKFADENRFREAYLFAYTNSFADKVLEPMRLVEGKYPQPGQQQFAIEQRMAEDFDLEVGDTIDVRMSGVAGFPTEQWTISAIVFHAYNDASDQALYADFADAPALTGIEGINSLTMRFTDYETAKTTREQVQTYVSANTPYGVVFALAEDPAQNSAIENTKQFRAILSALAIVAMLVSGFLVLNVISNLVTEQRRQIGVMKSLGATRSETFVIYGGIAVSYGVIGMIPGVLAGIPLGYQMAVIVGDFANTLIDSFAISPLAIVLGITLGLAVPVVSSIIPVFFGTRVSILDAMTDLGIGGNYRVGFVNRVVKSLPLPLNIKQSFNNLTQKKARLVLTTITLTLALTAFMGVSAVFVRLNEVLQDLLDQFEFQVIFQTTDAQDFDEVEALLFANVSGLEEIRPGSATGAALVGYVSPQTETNQVFVQGVVTDQDFEEGDFVEGRGWLDDPGRAGIVMSNEITKQIDKTVGDTVTLIIDSQPVELPIIGIINFPFPITMMPWQDLALLTGDTLGAPVANQYVTGIAVNDYTGTLPEGMVAAWGIDNSIAPIIEMIDGSFPVRDVPGVMVSAAFASNGNYALGDEIVISAGACLQPQAIMPAADMSTDTSAANTGTECVATLPIVGIFAMGQAPAGDASPAADPLTGAVSPGDEPADTSAAEALPSGDLPANEALDGAQASGEQPAETPAEAAQQLPDELVAFYWRDLAALQGIGLDGKPVPNAFYVLMQADDPDAREVDDMIEDINDTLGENGISADFTNMVEISDMAADSILSVGIILNLASLVMAAVGSIGLLTTLSIAVFERQKEIGVMRSVGAKSPTIIVQFLVEGVLVGILAWIIAAPLSVGLAWGLTNILPFGDFIEFAYPSMMFPLGLIGILIIATISSVWPSVSAARKTVSNILRYQ